MITITPEDRLMYLINKGVKKHKENKLNYMREVQQIKHPHLPPIDVTVIMCSLNEEELISCAASSIRNQTVIKKYPQFFEFILADNHSTDRTQDIASVWVDKIMLTPKGKLCSRHYATKEARGEIIVAVDADTYYPPSWLDLNLRYFYDKNVIGVTTVCIHSDMRNHIFDDAYPLVYLSRMGRMSGCSSLYYKWAYYKTGGFDLNIPQNDNKRMLDEEEYLFHQKLSKLGRIVTSPYPCYTSCRRFLTKLVKDKYSDDVASGDRF